jgi:hypothetical protein
MSPSTDPRAVPTVQLDNEMVTRHRVALRARREHGPSSPRVSVRGGTDDDGRLALTSAAGAASGDLVTGQAYFRPAGAEHDVKNANPYEFVFVEIELKALTPAPGGIR